MFATIRFALVATAAMAVATVFAAEKKDAKQDTGEVPAVLNFTMKNLSGEDVDLSKYQGKVLLIVNTASECGFTPQYEALEKLHEKYADQGLAVLGFPANNFGAQEPGTNAEIAGFCKKNYNVQFDMFAKVDVVGPNQCDLYKYLTSEESDPKHAGPVKWNFEKFIIGRNGEIVGRYPSAIKPDSPQVVKKIETELSKK